MTNSLIVVRAFLCAGFAFPPSPSPSFMALQVNLKSKRRPWMNLNLIHPFIHPSAHLTGLLLLLGRAARKVLLDVEVTEEGEQRYHVVHTELGHDRRVRLLHKHPDAVSTVLNKLKDLEGCEVLAPPEVLLPKVGIAARDGCEEVVRVHHHVHERVEGRPEPALATGHDVIRHPPEERDAHVVVAVQESHLIHVSLQHHNDGVEVLVELRKREDQDELSELGLLLVVSLTPNLVVVFVNLVNNSSRHVGAEDNEEDVVDQDQELEQGWVLLALGLLLDEELGKHHEDGVDQARGHDDGRRLDPVRLLPQRLRRILPNVLSEHLLDTLEHQGLHGRVPFLPVVLGDFQVRVHLCFSSSRSLRGEEDVGFATSDPDQFERQKVFTKLHCSR
mmetsp:Transcript_4894/g.12481  ORF Transcript_4894/g.12481 Transcript_4894/m.12481 type:complete len:389 (-) Transcript_4894:147-1313(-)